MLTKWQLSNAGLLWVNLLVLWDIFKKKLNSQQIINEKNICSLTRRLFLNAPILLVQLIEEQLLQKQFNNSNFHSH